MTTLPAAPARLDLADYLAERRPALLRAARAIARNHQDAEDLLQSALTSVIVRWSDIRDHRAADAYVRRAMVNQHASWFRQKWRTHERATEAVPEPRTGPPEPEEHDLWPLVVALPPKQRSAVVLRYYEDLTEAETATALSCSRGTVKSNTSRGVASLRRTISGTVVPAPERAHP